MCQKGRSRETVRAASHNRLRDGGSAGEVKVEALLPSPGTQTAGFGGKRLGWHQQPLGWRSEPCGASRSHCPASVARRRLDLRCRAGREPCAGQSPGTAGEQLCCRGAEAVLPGAAVVRVSWRDGAVRSGRARLGAV